MANRNDDFTAAPVTKTSRAQATQDMPGYQRREAIKPAAGAVGFNQAMGEVAKGYEMYGAIGSQIASSISQQSSQLAGIEAGQTPGQKFGLPAITAADKTFRQNYAEESTKVLASQADSYINKISYEFNKIPEPTGADLAKFAASRGDVGAFAQNADPTTKHNLARLINDKYEGEIYKFASKVDSADRKRLLGTVNSMSMANSINISEYYTGGNTEAGDRAYQAQLWNLQTAFENKLITSDELAKGKLELKSLKEFSIANGARMQAFNENGEAGQADYVNNYNKQDHPGMTYLEKKSITDGLVKAAAEDSKVRHLSQDLAYSQAHTELIALGGNIPADRWREVQSKVSNTQYNSLQELYIKLNAEDVANKQLASAISRDKNDVKAMSNYTAKQVNGYFKDAVAAQKAQIEAEGGVYTNPLLHEANIASTIKAPVTDFVESLDRTLKYGDAQQAIDAAKAITALSVNNPIALQGMDKETRSTASAFDAFRTNTVAGDQVALDNARKSTFNLSPDVLAERTIGANKWMTESHGSGQTYQNSNKLLKDKIVGSMGGKRWFSKNTIVPDGMTAQFRELMPSYYLRTGDSDRAWSELTQDMAQVWQETGTNNRPEFMRNPPEQAANEMNVGYYLPNSKAFALHQMIEENKRLNSDPNAFVMNKYEWPDNPFAGKNLNEIDWIKDPFVKGNPKIMVNGKLTEVVIKSDMLTVLPANDTVSWSFWTTVEDGRIEGPLSDLNQPNGIARWNVSPGIFKEQTARYNQQEMAAATQIKLIKENEVNIDLMESDVYWLDKDK